MLNLKSVKRTDLKAGDYIVTYGGIFKITHTFRVYETKSPTQANYCTFVRDFRADQACSIPTAWRVDWNEQGTDRATSMLITNPDALK